jgi:hypothetical protein
LGEWIGLSGESQKRRGCFLQAPYCSLAQNQFNKKILQGGYFSGGGYPGETLFFVVFEFPQAFQVLLVVVSVMDHGYGIQFIIRQIEFIIAAVEAVQPLFELFLILPAWFNVTWFFELDIAFFRVNDIRILVLFFVSGVFMSAGQVLF